jgi:hypothetical protein
VKNEVVQGLTPFHQCSLLFSPKRTTRQQRLVLKTLHENSARGQLWAAFYDAQYRVAKRLAGKGFIEEWSFGFTLLGAAIQFDPPDRSLSEDDE